MSHEIIKHRFALYFEEPTIRQHKNAPDTVVLFTEFSSSNNVLPRTYSGEVRCLNTLWSFDQQSSIGERITLPVKIWEEGYYANDGMLKAYPGRDVSGTGWIQGWQKIARRPIPIALSDGRLSVSFDLSVWISKARVARYAAGEDPGFDKNQQDIRAAWESLIMPMLQAPGTWHSNARMNIRNTQQLSHACALMNWKPADYKGYYDGDSFGIHLCLSEYEGEELARIYERIPEPESARVPRLEPRMIVELYGNAYTLIGKSKSSWQATKDGKTYRIGPKHFHQLKILTAA